MNVVGKGEPFLTARPISQNGSMLQPTSADVAKSDEMRPHARAVLAAKILGHAQLQIGAAGHVSRFAGGLIVGPAPGPPSIFPSRFPGFARGGLFRQALS